MHWVGLTILGRPRSSRDARPYLDTADGAESRPYHGRQTDAMSSHPYPGQRARPLEAEAGTDFEDGGDDREGDEGDEGEGGDED